MLDITSYQTQCPYCGERIELLLDPSVDTQEYIEDCQVCCCPMVVTVHYDGEGSFQVQVRTENEG